MILDLFDHKDWVKKTSNLIEDCIASILQKKNICNVMLTGGRCAKKIYREWSILDFHSKYNGVNFFITDERFLKSDDIENNSNSIKKILFPKNKINYSNIFHQFETDLKNIDRIIHNYEIILPSQMDITLLSIGDDGHVASIFPNDIHIINCKSNVSFVERKFKPDRFTVTPKYLLKSKRIFLLASEYSKKKLLTILLIIQILIPMRYPHLFLKIITG